MSENTQSMPSLAVQLVMAVFTSLAGGLLLFLFSWQRHLPALELGGWEPSVPAVLGIIVLLGLLLSIILLLQLWGLPEFKVQPKLDQNRRNRIIRLLRADAYSYLLLPGLIAVLLAWEQVGNHWLLWLVLLLATLTAKFFFLLEAHRLKQTNS